ncbi:glycosyltransferase family 1 protein [Bacillus sp. 03113]|uniref:glycosyltransferase family 4 protein n=1 Tax=Bacillus sp. 03113 TaxID=2578211 RepID=UPI001141CD49|nr:glycosyltransferase family 1 protein [Bacillus sp. 03113]
MDDLKGDSRLKVALFSDTFYPQVNGAARTLKRLTDHMMKSGIEYEIFVPEMKEMAQSYPNTNQFTSFPFFFYPECRAAIANPKKIMDQLRAFSPDLVHIATPLTMGLYGMYGAKRLNIPMTASYHTHFDRYLDYYKSSWLSPILCKYLKWFHQPFETIFVPSKETKIHLELQGFHSLSIWGRGVDCNQFHPNKNSMFLRDKYNIKEKHIVLYVGRLAPEKDICTLTNIIEHFPEKLQKEVHWLIVGNGPSYEELDAQMNEKENVTLTGYLMGDELSQAYASADLFVFPSATETFGNVVLEALASGTPAIVADAGGVKEIVMDNATGKVCPPKDHQAFIRAIMELLENEKKLRRMELEARNFALQQSWDTILDQLLDEFENIALHRSTRLKHA